MTMKSSPFGLRFLCCCGFSIAALGTLTSGNAQDVGKLGGISGIVRFTGKAPAPQKIVTSDGAVLMHNDLVVDPKTKGLRYVAVYVSDAPARATARDAKAAVIDQRDMVFVPRVVVAQAGQKVRIENSDLCNHAVNSVSTTPENLFNVLTPMGQPFEFAFKAQKSPVQLGCALHPWMRAWVFVLPHPLAAVSDAQGRFTIDGITPGQHTIQLAHPDTGMRAAESVIVTAGKTTQLLHDWPSIKK